MILETIRVALDRMSRVDDDLRRLILDPQDVVHRVLVPACRAESVCPLLAWIEEKREERF